MRLLANVLEQLLSLMAIECGGFEPKAANLSEMALLHSNMHFFAQQDLGQICNIRGIVHSK